MKDNHWFEGGRLGLAAAILFAAVPASAQMGVYVLKLDDGVSKRQTLQVKNSGQVTATQNLGAGNEHAALAIDGTTLVVVHASNNIVNTKGPSAIKCVSIDMHPDAPPTIRSTVQLTYSNSDRLGHPAIAADGSGHFLVAYGANNIQGNSNTQTYSLVVDADCKDLTSTGANPGHPEEEHVKLSQDGNNNIAAPRLVWDGKKFVGGIYKNNDAEYAFLAEIRSGQQNGQLEPHLLSDNQRLTPSNIGRPSILVMNDTRALYAAPKGSQRPSEKGDEVAYLNTDTGALTVVNNKKVMPVLWRKVVVEAQPDPNNMGGIDGLPGSLGGNGIYPASPSLAMGENGDVYITTFISSGSGRNKNKKGSSTSYVARLTVDDTGFTKVAEQSDVALESSHIVACSGMIGVVGQEQHALAIYGAPISGYGSSSMTFVQHDPMTNTFPQLMLAAVSPTNADGGYLSNMLGRNPGTQGREHLNCVGDVPNVGYGASFMPHVKTFFVAPWTGRVNLAPGAPTVLSADGRMLPEDRNALFITFLAGVRDPQQPPPPPPATDGGGGGGGHPGADGGTPGTPGTPGTDGMAGSFSSCAVGGGAPRPAPLFLLGLLVVLGLARRRVGG